jgi:hypothetical protein
LFDPTVRLVGGRASADGSNPYARTYAQAFMSLAGLTALYGAKVPATIASAVPGVSINESNIVEWMNDNGVPMELNDYLLDGIIGGTVSRMAGERIDVASRWSAISAVQDTINMMVGSDGGLIIGGPAASLWTTGKNLSALYYGIAHQETLDPERAHRLMVKAAARATMSGWRDWERAEAIMKLGKYTTSAGTEIPGIENISSGAGIAQLFGLPPERIQAHYRNQSEEFDLEERMRFYIQQAESIVMGSLNDLPEGSSTNDVIELIREGWSYIDAMMGEVPAAEEAKTRLFNNIMNTRESAAIRQLEKLLTFSTPEQARSRIIETINNNPDKADFIRNNYLIPMEQFIEAQKGNE